MSKVAVVGAGASGLMVAGLLANSGHDVTVFDKNEKVGKKLFITGKGRCNLTNLCQPEDFLQNVVRGEKFLRSAIFSFTSQDCVDFFENLGIKTKVERGNRVFPASDKSSDVIKALKEHCKNVCFSLENEVLAIKKLKNSPNVERCEKNNFEKETQGKSDVALSEDTGNESECGKFLLITQKGKFEFDKVIVATGGKSYRATGSDGAGYAFAKSFGHEIVELRSALCPIRLKDKFVKNLQGISLKNVELNVLADGKKFGLFGEMIFTDQGISGPIVLTASSLINRCQNVFLSLDFKPALSNEQLDARLLRDFEENKNKDLKNVLKGLLPKAVADIFAGAIGLDENKKINSITKAERVKLLDGLKNFKLTYGGLYDIDTGIVTSGGVNLKEVNPKTFESKLEKGLYFTGEVLDLDALTGGYNLQIAWATAYACAKNFGL